MIAGLIIIVTMILVLSIYSSKPVIEDTHHQLINFMDFLSRTTMKDVRDSYQFAYNAAFEEDLDLYVYQKVYKLHMEGQTDNATDLVKSLSNIVVPLHIGFEYLIGDEIIYNRTSPAKDFAKTSLTGRVMTYYLNESSDLLSLNITVVSVWS